MLLREAGRRMLPSDRHARRLLPARELLRRRVAIKLLPDSSRFSAQARFFNLGRSAGGTGVFSVYRTNGKQIRVIYARQFDPEEQFFYQRKLNQTLAQ